MNARIAPNGRLYLNVGCGSRFSLDWNNLDLWAQPGVIAYDLRQPLPFPADGFDVAYSSHCLEHFTPAAGENFLREQHRVLKPGGVIRVVVPDLERCARDYLAQLEAVRNRPDSTQQINYEWGVLQLIDQIAREDCGGEMLRNLHAGRFDPAFVQSRFGEEFASLAASVRQSGPLAPAAKKSFAGLRKLKWKINDFLGRTPTARNQGESHRWMYDSYSLEQLLAKIGFREIRVATHDVSRIPDWSHYRLDSTDAGDQPRKPDSLFVEAVK